MVRLAIPDGQDNGLDLLLTPVEATTLSRALHAVAEGNSAEKEIFMCPIASDGHFSGLVTEAGMAIGDHPVLPWPEIRLLSQRLADAAG